MLVTILGYCVLGAFVGLLAGLFGVGGGTIVVPMLVLVFGWMKMPPECIMHLALGTSLASIVFTSISSTIAHHKHGHVDWSIFRRIVPGILAGTYAGSFIAADIPSKILQVIFVVFLFYVSINMFRNKKTVSARQLPGTVGLNIAGVCIGAFSSLVGIGGGTLIVPFLTWHNVDMRRTVGTSASIGIPIALAGGIGYLLNGYNVQNLPDGAVGFVYLPALIGIVLASTLLAPVGASIAQRLPAAKLKRGFAVFLFCMALNMLFKALN